MKALVFDTGVFVGKKVRVAWVFNFIASEPIEVRVLVDLTPEFIHKDVRCFQLRAMFDIKHIIQHAAIFTTFAMCLKPLIQFSGHLIAGYGCFGNDFDLI